MNDIEKRLKALEKSARLYKIGFIAVLAFFAVTALMGNTATAPADQVVECRGLKLLDAMGRARAILQVTQKGVGIYFFDEKENKSVELGMLENGAGLIVYDPFGQERIQIDMFKGKPRFSYLDSRGTRRIGLGIAEEGQGMSLYDSSGKMRSKFDGDSIIFYDDRSRPRSEFSPSGMAVTDDYGKTRIGLRLMEDGPKLLLFNKNQDRIFEAP